ncbi:MAG: hypothetical protein K9L30_12765 [Desulfobacterales bacterium]|nr:hypothetical protein [Desulfobacterales bacterium]
MNTIRYYSLSTIKTNLLHFLTGKVFSALSTITVLLLLARILSKDIYAIYVLFQAMVSFVGMLASFGITQSSFRYIPELRSKNNNKAMYRFLFSGVLSRFLIFGFVMLLVFLIREKLAGYYNFESWVWLLPWYLLAGWFRLTGYFLAKVMESLMWQKSSQYTLAIAGLTRLFMVCWYYFVTADIDFQKVVMIEVFVEGFTLMILVLTTLINWRSDDHKDIGDQEWWVKNRRRVNRYGFMGYLKALTGTLYGNAPNRMVAARFLPLSSMGEYGFAGSISMFLRRFLPTRLLHGMIRPLFIDRFSQNQNFHELNKMANFTFRVNLVILVFSILGLVLAGKPVFDWITLGKYGSTAYLIAAIIGVLILESLLSQHELICLTLEKNGIIIWGNLLRSISLGLSLFFISKLGAWAIVLANAVGNFLAIIVVWYGLKRSGKLLTFDAHLIIRIVISLIIAILTGFLIDNLYHIIPFTLLSAFIIFGLLIWYRSPFSDDEHNLIHRLFSRENNKTKISGKQFANL